MGRWRPLNLCRPPFSLPEPEQLVNEDSRPTRSTPTSRSASGASSSQATIHGMTGELDRGTAERVIARAMELSGRERRGLSPDQLVAIGAELGVAEVHVRRALAEVLSKPQRVRALDRSVHAARHVELLPAEADRLLGTWFEQVDGMRALRHTGPELGVWAPRTGVVAGARAAMAKAGGADLDLRESTGVTSTVEPIGDQSALVRLEARVKRDYAMTAGIVGAGGTAPRSSSAT